MSAVWKSEEGARVVRERYLQFLEYWPVPHRRHTLPTREGETFVIECGANDAPPLVLLHGAGFNSVTWMGDVAEWSRRFRVFAVDVIGEPGLSAPSRPAYGTDRYARWLEDVLAALGVTRASFVGISLGGWLALDFAVRRPERVASLVLLAPGGLAPPRMSMLTIWLVILPLLALGDWGRRRALAKILNRSPDVRPSPEAAAVADFMSLIFRHYKARTAKAPIFGDDALRRLAMPVLLIVGGRDPMVNADEARRRAAERLPRAEIRYLPDAGHDVVGQTEPVLEFLLAAVG